MEPILITIRIESDDTSDRRTLRYIREQYEKGALTEYELCLCVLKVLEE